MSLYPMDRTRPCGFSRAGWGIVLGLLFLKYIEDAFEERRATLAGAVAEPESEYFVADESERDAELAALTEDLFAERFESDPHA